MIVDFSKTKMAAFSQTEQVIIFSTVYLRASTILSQFVSTQLLLETPQNENSKTQYLGVLPHRLVTTQIITMF